MKNKPLWPYLKKDIAVLLFATIVLTCGFVGCCGFMSIVYMINFKLMEFELRIGINPETVLFIGMLLSLPLGSIFGFMAYKLLAPYFLSKRNPDKK